MILSAKMLSSAYLENHDDFIRIISVSSFTLNSIPSLNRIYRKRPSQQQGEQIRRRKRWRKENNVNSYASKPKSNETITIDLSLCNMFDSDDDKTMKT